MANKTTNQSADDLQPALNELGRTKCPVCRSIVTVFLTKTKRPFLNCSLCSARIFYNGRESIRLLQRNMKPAIVHRNR